jgi:hypothetical protein
VQHIHIAPEVAPLVDKYFPTGQPEHMEAPEFFEKVPAAQSTHVKAVVASIMEEYFPTRHKEH